MLHQRSPHVLCVTQRLRNTELVDPSFQWHGPKGKIVSGRILFLLSYLNRYISDLFILKRIFVSNISIIYSNIFFVVSWS